jgi:NADH:ubiquinone oxidoreductase subunit K
MGGKSMRQGDMMVMLAIEFMIQYHTASMVDTFAPVDGRMNKGLFMSMIITMTAEALAFPLSLLLRVYFNDKDGVVDGNDPEIQNLHFVGDFFGAITTGTALSVM